MKATTYFNLYKQTKRKKYIVFIIILVITMIFFFLSLFINRGGLSFSDSFKTFFGILKEDNNRFIIFNIRMPSTLAALIIGFGLAISGQIMQVNLNNKLASPSTLGVSSSALLGATLSIIIFNNGSIYNNSLFQTSFFALFFAFISILFILFLSKVKNFSPTSVAIIGVAITSFTSAITTILQFFASDTLLSSSVRFSFGDLSRASFNSDLYIFIIVIISFIFFMFSSNKYNALYSDDNTALSLGINVSLLRFVSLLLASLICAVSVAFVGIIGFIGIIAPHIVKLLIGNDNKYVIPISGIFGSAILLLCDTISKVIIPNFPLPVGAVTSIIGAPIFISIILNRGSNNA